MVARFSASVQRRRHRGGGPQHPDGCIWMFLELFGAPKVDVVAGDHLVADGVVVLGYSDFDRAGFDGVFPYSHADLPGEVHEAGE